MEVSARSINSIVLEIQVEMDHHCKFEMPKTASGNNFELIFL